MHNDIRVMPPVPEVDSPKPTHNHFQTPEEVAAHDNVMQPESPLQHESIPIAAAVKHKKQRKFWPPSRKQLIICSSVVLGLLLIGGGMFLAFRHNRPVTVNIPRKIVPPKAAPVSNTVPSTLTGLPVAPSVNQRPITAVMIENLPPARPQSGLSQAGVVIEALTEGGITRFIAFFQDQLAANVGPIRSARPYYLDWALGFDAPLAHVGGSPTALAEIPALGVKNLDYMFYPGYYTRITSRPAPHNVYTSISRLMSLEASLGWTSSSFTGWARKADSPSKNPNATNIDFTLSYSTYNVSYSYSPSTNSYNRSEGGAPQIDANTGKQISPKVVIGMVVPWSQGPMDSSNAYYSVYQTTGSGQAYVFQDGTVTVGQWNKPTPQSPLTFTTQSGQPLKLNAGQTWITALASSSEIRYN